MITRATLYGLRLESDLPLPELAPGEWDGPPDICVRLGQAELPPVLDEEMHLLQQGAGFRIAGVAAYAVRHGTEIVVQPEVGAPDRNVRLYLLGSAMGMILHQRGLLPLHANAVEIEGRAFAFMGSPGMGKSTLAAWMDKGGHRIIADDVCVTRLTENGGAEVSPGMPRLRLWRNSVEALGRATEGLPRSYLGDESYDKYDVPLASRAEDAVPLGAIFLLTDGDHVSADRIGGAAAVSALVENTYRGSYVPLAGGAERHWRQCMQLASTVPLFRLQRPRGLDRMDELATWLSDFCRSIENCKQECVALSSVGRGQGQVHDIA